MTPANPTETRHEKEEPQVSGAAAVPGLFVTLPADGRGWLPYWFRSQLSGIAMGLTVCFVVWLIIGGVSPAGLAYSIVITLVYSLSIGGLLAATLPFLPTRILNQPSVSHWLMFLALTLAVSAAGSGLSGVVLFAVGVLPAGEFWPRFYFISRIAIFFTATFVTLTYAYGAARSRLEARSRDLEEQVARGGREIETQREDFAAAREIQVNLLPRRLPIIRGYAIAGAWQPARAVGGDYFDVLRLGESSVALCVGDVVGKGVSAALLMANLQAVVKVFAAAADSPTDLCRRVNRVMFENIASGKFVTFFYGVLDVKSHRLAYCRAGHNPPLLLRRDGSTIWLEQGGPVLGVFPEPDYAQGAVQLVSGDALVLYTDGVTEATDIHDEEFGEERLVTLVRATGEVSADRLQAAIMEAVAQFCGGRFVDDATLLVLTVD